MPEFEFKQNELKVYTLRGHKDGVTSVKVSSDGKYIVSGSWDSTIKIWDLHSKKEIKSINAYDKEGINSIDISPDGKTIVSCAGYEDSKKKFYEIKFWGLPDGEFKKAIIINEEEVDPENEDENPNCVFYVKFSPDGNYIAGCTSEKIKIWNANSFKLIKEISEPRIRYFKNVSYSPNSQYIISATSHGLINIWELKTGTFVKRLGIHSSSGPAIFSLDGKLVISGGGYRDNLIKIVDFQTGKVLKTMQEHSDYISDLALSSEGKYIVSAGGYRDRSVKLWDLKSRELIHSFEGHKDSVFSVCFTPNGKYIVSAAADSTIKVWNLVLYQESDKLDLNSINFSIPKDQISKKNDLLYAYSVATQSGHSDVITCLTISKDGKYLISGSYDNTIKVWDFFRGSLLKTLKGHRRWILSVAISPNGKFIASSSMDGEIKLWDFDSGENIYSLLEDYEEVSSIKFSKDGKYIAWLVYGNLRLRNFGMENLLVAEDNLFDFGNNSIRSYAFSPNKEFLVASSSNKLLIWDLINKKMIKEIETSEGEISCLEITPDNEFIIGATYSNSTIKIWEIRSGILKNTTKTKRKYAYLLALSPDGKYFATSSSPSYVYEEVYDFTIWDFESGKKIKSILGHDARIESLKFSPDGKYIVSASEDATIKIWDFLKGTLKISFEKSEGGLSSMIISPNKNFILTSTDDGVITKWEYPNGNLIKLYKGHSQLVKSIKISKDSKFIISGSKDNTIKIWLSETGEIIKSLRGHMDCVNSVDISNNSKFIASGSMDGTIKLWDFKTGTLINTFTFKSGGQFKIGDFKWVHSVSISPNSKYIAGGCQDGSIKIWDLESGSLIQNIKASLLRITYLQFTLDNRFVATSSVNNLIKFWDVKSGIISRDYGGYHEDYITTFTISDDGKYLASGSNDNIVVVRSLENKFVYGPFQLSSPVLFVSIISEETTLIAGDTNGDILVWDFTKKIIESQYEVETKIQTPMGELNRVEQISLLVNEVKDFVLGNETRIPKEDIPEILMEIAQNEINLLIINLGFAYFGIKDQLVNERQYNDAINSVSEIMGWEKNENKKKVGAFKWIGFGMESYSKYEHKKAIKFFNEALKIDSENLIAIGYLAQSYEGIGDFKNAELHRKKGMELAFNEKNLYKKKVVNNLEEEFEALFDLFYEKQKLIKNFHKKRIIYKNFIHQDEGSLVWISHILDDIRNYILDMPHKITESSYSEVAEDILNVILEWISIVSGVSYYILKHDLGTNKEKEEVLDALLGILGWGEHRDLFDAKFQNDLPKYKEENLPHKIDSIEDDNYSKIEEIDKLAIEAKLEPSQLNALKDLKKLVLHFEPEIEEENGNIVELFFWQNWIDKLPDSIGELTSLRRLTLGMNHLADLPESFTNLQKLEELNLDGNDFTSIPSQILLIKSLKTLDMSANKLEDIPTQIKNIDSLEFLNLSYNHKLKQLPESLGNLKNLKILDVEQCYDLNIPENIRLKKNLTIKGIDDLKSDRYGNININLLIRDFGSPPVIYYAEEDMREKVIDKDKLVILDDIIRIKYSYPLDRPVEIEFEKKGGFTRLDLYGCIYEGYRTIYQEEEEVAGDPGTYRFVMNRRHSNGPYGIWGHYLSELFIEGISYNPKTKIVTLTIGS